MVVNRGSIPAGSDTVLFSYQVKSCSSFRVDVPSGSSYGILVHVDGLHDADQYVPVPAGSSWTFTYENDKIKRVLAQGDTGTATNVIWSPVVIGTQA